MHKTVFLAALAAIACGCAANPQYVTYEEFGAVGDGIHDDQAAIVAAHAAANDKKLPVKAKDGATYYIGRGAEVAVIKTDVDFGTARFIIDDVETDDYRANIFIVKSYMEPHDAEGVTSLKRGQENLGITLPCRSLVEVTDETHRVYIRRGANQNNGTSKKEMLVVDKDGSIDQSAPVVWDYDGLPAEGLQVKAWPIDEKPLTIKGGTFITVANKAESKYNYRNRNIVISRSNARIEGLCHYIVGEGGHGAPYGGFLTVNHAVGVTISDCLLTPHKTYGTIGSAGVPVQMGSYDIQAEYSIGLRVKNLRQTISIDDREYWGLFASNFSKDIRMEDCVISRFDAHMGVCNVTLTGCTFGHMGLQFVGFGTALIENCEVHRNKLIWLRSDYGSSWDGEIMIRNCKLVLPEGSNSAFVLEGSNDGHHDFGYACTLPALVEIDGLTIDDSKAGAAYRGPRVYNGFDRDVTEDGLIPFPSDGKVTLKNVTASSGKAIEVSDNKAMFAGAE